MKRIFAILALLILMLTTLPALAQDATDEPDSPVATVEATPADTGVTVNIDTTDNPTPATPLIDWQTLITGILAVVVVLNQYTNGGVVKTVAGIFKVSEDRAQEWYDRGVKAGIQHQIIEALKTPGKDDDEKAYRLARDAGYKVITLEDGTPTLVKVSAG